MLGIRSEMDEISMVLEEAMLEFFDEYLLSDLDG